MSGEHPIGHRPINWSAIGVVTSILGTIALGAMGYGILSEKISNLEIGYRDRLGVDREQNESIVRIREDRALEREVADLKTEVRLLRQAFEQQTRERRK